MNGHPSAFIPSTEATRELRKLWDELDLSVDGLPQVVMPDGRRTVMSTAARADTLDVRDGSFGNVSLPWLYVDFYDFLAIQPREIGGVPSSADQWLRMTVRATYTLGNRYGTSPIECTVDDAADVTFDWVDASLGTPTSEAGIIAGVEGEYYFYIVRYTGGRISQLAPSAIFEGWPSDSKV